jgi:hypothetical protein
MPWRLQACHARDVLELAGMFRDHAHDVLALAGMFRDSQDYGGGQFDSISEHAVGGSGAVRRGCGFWARGGRFFSGDAGAHPAYQRASVDSRARCLPLPGPC